MWFEVRFVRKISGNLFTKVIECKASNGIPVTRSFIKTYFLEHAVTVNASFEPSAN